MTLQNIRIGDIVKCNVGGRLFHATVVKRIRGGLNVYPITHNISYREVTARQVVEHWRKSKAS